MARNQNELFKIMQEVGELLHKRHNGSLSQLESVMLQLWLHDQPDYTQENIEDFTEPEQIEDDMEKMKEIDEKAAWEDVKGRIALEMGSPFPPEPPKRNIFNSLFNFKSLIPVFGILILIAVSVALFRNTRKTNIPSEPVAFSLKKDVPPGGEKAILTLADGKQIVLDNASNGQLANQGATKVIKLANGKLAYNGTSSHGQPVSYNSITTPRGGQYQVTLPDGSVVWLNAASSLRFPTAFSGNDRMVELSGEGYFQIKKHAAMPFKVAILPPAGNPEKGAVQVEVLGTEFNVMAYPEESLIRTSLVEGRVKVSKDKISVTVAPGQQAQTGHANDGVNLVAVDIKSVIAWKRGFFNFDNTDLKTLMRQISRWYDIEVVYEGKIKDQRFDGLISRDLKLSEVLHILEGHDIHFTIKDKKIIVAASTP
ncbi:FecR family protein [Flavitalea flava]